MLPSGRDNASDPLREVAKLTPAANAEHRERIQARATERAAGLDRGIGL